MDVNKTSIYFSENLNKIIQVEYYAVRKCGILPLFVGFIRFLAVLSSINIREKN
jgi:hypothetical protein